jgi:hypothetical protein
MSTITVDQRTHEKLKTMCEEYGIKQGEFVKLAVDFYTKNGLNPKDNFVSAKQELETMNKRLSSVIGYINTFERNQMQPLIKQVETTAHHLERLADKMGGEPKETKPNKLVEDKVKLVEKSSLLATKK